MWIVLNFSDFEIEVLINKKKIEENKKKIKEIKGQINRKKS